MADEGINLRVDAVPALGELNAMQLKILGPRWRELMKRLARESRDRLRKRTPKGWTGKTRRDWRVIRRHGLSYIVGNDNPVMKWLDEGTRAHGPVTAKALFIPLSRRAALQEAVGDQLIYGQDFVLAKRVRGIKAMRIVEYERKVITFRSRVETQKLVNRILRETNS